MIVDIPKWSAPEHVKALTTTRVGGVSIEPYSSLNLGDHVHDSDDSVLENRRRVSRALTLPNEPVWLTQTHSNIVHNFDAFTSSNTLAQRSLIGDGSTTNDKGIVCVVLTADCLPLFLSDRKGTRVAIVHVGWRGLADGIVEAGVSAFDAEPENIIAWAGPCISRRHFEVGPEVRVALGGSDRAYLKSPNRGKLLADLYQLTGERLTAIGVNNYGYSSACTFRDHDRFFSYRREGECGRMASLIWLEDKLINPTNKR